MLGVCLLFVGIVLINNGMCTLYHVDGRSAAVMNIFTGGLSLFINFVNLVQGNYYAAGTGLLFCFTYLFVAVNKFLNATRSLLRGFRPLLPSTLSSSERSKASLEARRLASRRISAGRASGICGPFSGVLLLWRISAERSSENLCRAFRYLRALSPRGSRAS
mgnify:CR=1 FL=1